MNLSFKSFANHIIALCILVSSQLANAQSWLPLGNGFNNSVLSTCKLPNGDTLLAAGRFIAADGKAAKYIAYYHQNQWTQLGNGLDNPVKTVTYIDGEIYVGGEFAYYGDSLLGCVAKWNGEKFVGFANGFFKSGQHSVAATVNAIISYKNQLYVGGGFDYSNNKVDYLKNIAKWNGTKWEEVAGGIVGNSGVNCMLVFKDTLYVAGGFATAGATSTANIAKWDGTNWTAVGAGMNNEITSLTSFNDTLYAGGVFTQADGKPLAYLAKWNGSNWLPVGGGVNGPVYALTSFADKLFVGGYFNKADGNACINLAKWNGQTFEAMGNPNSTLRTFANDGYLVAAGDFTNIGGNAINRVAHYDVLNAIDEPIPSTYAIYPNPVSTILHIDQLNINEHVATITNILGNTVWSGSYISSISVETLKPGMYFLTFPTAHQPIRFIKN